MISGDVMKIERPILMSGPMVRMTLADQKTRTRRTRGLDVINRSPDSWSLNGIESLGAECLWIGLSCNAGDDAVGCPYGKPGDRLWVRETWAVGVCADALKPSALDAGTWKRDNGGVWYLADGTQPATPISARGKWRPSIFMPRWASRIILEITQIRVERLQHISTEDIIAEGIQIPVTSEGCPPGKVKLLTRLTDKHNHPPIDYLPKNPREADFYRAEFASAWDGLNFKRGFGWKVNPWVWVIGFKRLRSK